MKEVLKLEHIQKYYGNGGNVTKAIQDISFSVQEGEFVGIMGASGSGKTTLLNCISTIDTVSAGHIYLDGTDVTEINEKQIARFRRENLGFVFQDFNLLDTLTISENIALALTINKVPAGEIDGRVREMAGKLNIADILDKYPYQVSGGQKQRCACARAMINTPKLILADEPTGALDSHSSQMLLSTIQSINETLGATILMVTHDAFSASYLYTVPNEAIEALALSDYNRLREILGLSSVSMSSSEFLVHCDTWNYMDDIQRSLEQRPEITLNGQTLTAAQTPILTEPMEQYQMAGTNGYVLVLPDEAASQLSGTKIRLVMKLADGGSPELRSQLRQFLNSGKWQPDVQPGQELPERVTMAVTVKAWGVANSLTGFTAISFSGLYLSIIFIILSCSVAFRHRRKPEELCGD